MSEETVRSYWQMLDAADWDHMADLLAPTFKAHYPATAEGFDKSTFVRLNAEYPGRWNAEVLDLVAIEQRVVTLARVFSGSEAHVVTSWFTVVGERVRRLLEVWAEEGSKPSAERRP